MSKLTLHFTDKARQTKYADSLTVMFADTRSGMDDVTQSAFTRLKARSDVNPAYVAKIEASVGRAPAGRAPTTTLRL